MLRLSYSVLMLVACDSAGSSLSVPDPEVLKPTKPRPTDPKPLDDELFDPDRVLEIDVFVSELDWQRILKQVVPEGFITERDCQDAPFPELSFYRATVVIDRRIVEDVGIRQHGFLYQLNNQIPPLELGFDTYVPNRRFLGRRRMLLESSPYDPTGMRSCLAYRVFARAGVPAPRCTLAHVRVNGADHGVYTHVEAIDEDFAAVSGPLYQGKASDFRDGWMETFVGPFDRTPLRTVRDALTASDDQLIERLSAVVDLDRFYTFWAAETVMGHFDGYAGNADRFFVYQRPDQRLVFLPSGTDVAFQPYNFLGTEQPASVYAQGELARRLYLNSAGQPEYLEELRGVLREVWDEDELLAETQRMEALIAPRTRRQEFKVELERLRSFIRDRRAAIERDIGADWNMQRRPTFCIVPRGSSSAEFTTTWDSLPATGDISAIFQSGTGTLSASFDGIDYVPVRAAGAAAGTTAEGYAIFAIIADTGFGSALVLYVAMDPGLVAPGTFAIGEQVYGYVAWYNGADQLPVWSSYLSGTLELTSASTVPGAPIAARVSADLY